MGNVAGGQDKDVQLRELGARRHSGQGCLLRQECLTQCLHPALLPHCVLGAQGTLQTQEGLSWPGTHGALQLGLGWSPSPPMRTGTALIL